MATRPIDEFREHIESHRTRRIGWLRAAVLGANDGIVSTASLVMGVAAASVDVDHVLLAGASGLVAGAMSMAAGEYVSVSSQADTEAAELDRERRELETHPANELAEIQAIYMDRGLDEHLAGEVASQLMEYDALATHARDELGLTETAAAHPLQAALVSAVTFSTGAALPLLVVWLSPFANLLWPVALAALVFLAVLGALAAYAGGAPVTVAAARVTFWGAFAMALTSAVGALFGTQI